MHVSFRETFGEDVDDTTTFSGAVADKLSENLPRGARYYVLENGDLAIGPEPGETFTLGGFNFVLTPEMEAVLGASPTQAQVLNYSYNSQKPIKMELVKQGLITVNGCEIEADRFMLGIQHELRFDEDSFIAFPSPLPGPRDIEIAGGDETMTLKVRRLPNDSADTMLFESDREAPLSVRYTVTELDEGETAAKAHFSISTNPGRCKDLSGVIRVLRILKAASTGMCAIAGMRIGAPKTNSWSPEKEQMLQWLEKAHAIEGALDVRFDPGNIALDNDAAATIAELYFGLVQRLPVKSPLPEASIDIGEREIPTFEETVRKGEEFAFTYTRPAVYTLFGKDLELQSVNGIFDLQAREIVRDPDGNYQIVMKNPPNEPGGYISKVLLPSEDALNSYYSEPRMTDVMETLQRGKPLSEYLKED